MPRPQSVMLVHPGTDSRYGDFRSRYLHTPPPLGLVILAELARQTFPDVTIRVIDGNYTSLETLKADISSHTIDLLGLTDWFTNHDTCLDIARFAKSQHPACRIVLGGPNAGHLARQVLCNRDFVDAIVAEDGEDAFLSLLAGSDFESVPNLNYRHGHDIVASPIILRDLNTLPLLRFDHPDLGECMRAYDSRRTGYASEQLAPFPLSSIRGCIKAAASGRCSYCSLPQQKVRLTAPHRFWEQVVFLEKECGVTNLFETGDEFCVGTYPRQLLAAKPHHVHSQLRVYTQPANLVHHNVDVLQKLGVVSVTLGVEHVSPAILASANKACDTIPIQDRLDVLLEHHIRPHLCFLFGLPGETHDSACRNIECVLALARAYGNQIGRLHLALAIPTAGCAWFADLSHDPYVQHEYLQTTGRALERDDTIDYHVLTRLSVQTRTTVAWTWLNDALDQAQTQISGMPLRSELAVARTVAGLTDADDRPSRTVSP